MHSFRPVQIEDVSRLKASMRHIHFRHSLSGGGDRIFSPQEREECLCLFEFGSSFKRDTIYGSTRCHANGTNGRVLWHHLPIAN